MFGKKIKNVGIVCNDAGSANIIINWVKFYRYNYFINTQGPAKKIFKRILPKFCVNTRLANLVNKSEIIITGTSSISDLDNRARILSIKNKKRVIAIIDHWTLYKERFIYKNKLILPNEIWVTDRNSLIKAKKIFKKTTIKQKKNLLENSLQKIKKNKSTKIRNYLYFLEPINNSIEFLALKKFSLFLLRNDIDKKINIKFKLHPRESLSKYKLFLKIFNKFNYQIINDVDLKYLFNWSQIIFGMTSYAMVLGLKAKRPVYSLLPIKKFKSTLPYTIKKIDKITNKELNIIKK